MKKKKKKNQFNTERFGFFFLEFSSSTYLSNSRLDIVVIHPPNQNATQQKYYHISDNDKNNDSPNKLPR